MDGLVGDVSLFYQLRDGGVGDYEDRGPINDKREDRVFTAFWLKQRSEFIFLRFFHNEYILG